MRTGKGQCIETIGNAKDYCDSLSELAGLVEASRQPDAHAPALVPYAPPPPNEPDRPRLVVCHDYKVSERCQIWRESSVSLTRARAQGGYTEGGAELRRDYTYNWWQFTDTFI